MLLVHLISGNNVSSSVIKIFILYSIVVIPVTVLSEDVLYTVFE